MSGCEDFFSTTLELEPPEFEDLLIVNSDILEGGRMISIFVGRNRGILETVNDTSYIVNDATVKITRLLDNWEEEALATIGNGLYRFDAGDDYFKFGETYNFQVSHPDFITAEATLTFPNKAVLSKSPDFNQSDGIDIDGDPLSSITLTIDDDPNEMNYYEVYIKPNVENGIRIPASSFDPAVLEGSFSRSLFIDDLSFNGTQKELKILINQFVFSSNINGLEVHWHAISEDEYQFQKTLAKSEENDGNPFVSPVQVASNIENGLGRISLKTKEIYEVR